MTLFALLSASLAVFVLVATLRVRPAARLKRLPTASHRDGR
ncbi:MAG TPA: hypothetical protein VKY73_02360 [Polyangiaceae bacterium]|nr:hypothetical protein [Polyangiaceae bacterium]